MQSLDSSANVQDVVTKAIITIMTKTLQPLLDSVSRPKCQDGSLSLADRALLLVSPIEKKKGRPPYFITLRDFQSQPTVPC